MTPSRIRARRRCQRVQRAGLPRRAVACLDDFEPIQFHGAEVVHAAPVVPLLTGERLWDLDTGERAVVAEELRAWPFPRGWDAPLMPTRYVGRSLVEAPPMSHERAASPPEEARGVWVP